MRKDTPLERLYNGIIKENPTFVMMLGMCPTLAVTTSAKNGIGMGLATMVILTASNLMISLLRKIIPDGVRMPAYIVVVASFVTIVEFLMEGFIPEKVFYIIDINILGYTIKISNNKLQFKRIDKNPFVILQENQQNMFRLFKIIRNYREEISSL